MKRWLALLLFFGLALAHDQPEDPVGDFVMTDWMILTSFFGFMIPALIITVVAWRKGYFHDLEGESKSYFLKEPDPDYETPPSEWETLPDWAQEVSRGRA